MNHVNLEQQTKEWYSQYYAQQGQWRNDVLRNPEVPFQVFANDWALLKALRSTKCQPEASRVLDVGCGNGTGLVTFMRFGFAAHLMTGIDLQADRFEKARERIPAARLVQGDAATMPFEAGCFDIVFESTMFVQLTDEGLAERIAAEMLRVCRPGGFLVLSDWRYSKPFNSAYRGLSRARIRRLFKEGELCRGFTCYRAALVPPVGRVLSRFAGPMYFLVHAAFPFLSGHIVTVLKRV